MSAPGADQRMRHQPRWAIAGAVPLAVGVAWLAIGWRGGVFCAIVASAPGLALVATGGALLFWAGDRLITHNMALAALVSLPLALIVSPWLGWLATAALLAGGAAAFIVAGFAAIGQNPIPAAVPWRGVSPALAGKAAVDEALLGWFVNAARIPRGAAVTRDLAEIRALAEIANERGWPHNAAAFHAAPDAPGATRRRSARAMGHAFEWLSFESGFAVDSRLPGAARWRGYAANRRVHARVFRHAGRPRPWLMCVHGYRMGADAMDLSLFSVGRLHHRLGYNLIMPMLPLHGARRATRLSGGLFLDGPLVDVLHAESQALWDLRRCLAWLRGLQPGQPIGVLGYSLGGYNAALLAAFEPALACVIAGIPLTDIPGVLWRHMPGVHLRYMESQGIDLALLRRLVAPVAPLALAPAVAYAYRHIFAASADQLVPPEQPARLWQHWARPPMYWFAGSHLSVRNDAGVNRYVERALAALEPN